MSTMKSKLRLTGAFAALAILALAASCQGFFPKATLQSMTLQPTTPTFGIGFQQPMQAWGTDSNNNRYQLTSGVVWSLSDPSTGTVATIDSTTGTMTGVNAGTITVSAADEGLSATATATVVEVVSAMTITPQSRSVIDDGTSYASYTITDQSGNNISSLVTLTAELNGAAVDQITCGYESQAIDSMQDCLPQTGLVPTGSVTYTIVVSYGGYTGAAVTATLQVNAP
jgi:Big-like domain-containing protein